jgi:hypothetical protein
LELLLSLQYIRLCGIERFFTEFGISAILLVAHSLFGCSINDVLQFSGSFYSETVYPLWIMKEFFGYMNILKWNSYEDSKGKFIWATINSNNKSLKHTERFIRTIISSNLFQIIWILKHCLLFGQWQIFRTPRSRVK